MSTELPRPRKKPANVKRVEILDPDRGDEDLIGEAWAAVTDDGTLISISTDITVVSQAAFKAGFWVMDQAYDGAY